jgi:sulfatase-modifying factor enzyme 1
MLQAHQLREHFNRAQPIKSLAGANSQQVSEFIQSFLTALGPIGVLGQKLTNKTIGIFVSSAPPGTMPVGKTNHNACFLSQLGVLGHFPSLVIRHAFTRRQRHAIERSAEALDRRRGCRVVHLHQHQIAAGALNQRSNRRAVVFALDQITLPMPRHQSIFNLRRTQVATDDGTYQAEPRSLATEIYDPKGINISSEGGRVKFPKKMGLKAEFYTPLSVDMFPPNPLGLYTMSDDGYEWVRDWYDPDCYKYSPLKDPQGPDKPVFKNKFGYFTKVLRGQNYANPYWGGG